MSVGLRDAMNFKEGDFVITNTGKKYQIKDINYRGSEGRAVACRIVTTAPDISFDYTQVDRFERNPNKLVPV